MVLIALVVEETKNIIVVKLILKDAKITCKSFLQALVPFFIRSNLVQKRH